MTGVRHRRVVTTLLMAALAGLAIAPGVAATGPVRGVTAPVDTDRDGLPDAWEARWGITDPHRVDSDRNGLPDSAEDPDGDGLGNLGERRVRTDPTDPDSDDDGVRDGRDDANRNGRADGWDQDRRPLPAGLHPTIKGAASDRPAGYDDGCHAGPFSPTVSHCVYGDAGASFAIAIFGDSHAQQWEPALDRLGKARHWRIISITKSGCPSADVRFRPWRFTGALPSCVAWRHGAEAWLRANPPGLIILSSAGMYPLIDAEGRYIPRAAREQAWAEGLARSFAAMPAESRVLVLGDTPHLRSDPLRCLRDVPFISRCATARSHAVRARHDQTERTAAEVAGQSFAATTPLVCPYDPCPLVIGRMLVWRNKGHLTATISRALAPGIGRFIDAALAPPASVKRPRSR